MTSVDDNAAAPSRKPVRRRELMRGAAWAAPVAAVSVAAPAVAASPGNCVGVEDGYATVTSALRADTPPFNTFVSTGGASAGRTVHQLLTTETYYIESTGTFTYSGSTNIPITELKLRFYGTPSFDWELVGTPTVSSSAGGVALGAAVPSPDYPNSTHGWTDVTLVNSGGDGYLHPGDVITLEWVYTPTGGNIQNSNGGCGGRTGYAYPGIYFRSCSSWEGPNPKQESDEDFDIYQLVEPECEALCEATTTASTPSFVRNSKTNGYFRWSNFFESGDELRLQVVSAATLDNAPAGSGDVITSNNLQWDAPMNADGAGSVQAWGGSGGPDNALRISLGNVSYERHLETTFKLVYRKAGSTQFVDATLSDLTFSIFDIDGGGSNQPPFAERVVASTPGGRTSSFRSGSILTGDGSGGAPWRAIGGTQNNENWHPRATVDVQASGPMNQFSVTFRGDATNASGGQTQSNIWIAPFHFTAANPSCT
ncbi:hypothetical protein [Brachybacterium hainanense]|uniref:Uncharacterized protein n=1 Tax=Brachybacterium hainanense TaxID=1541174 RepID=A0ABV6R9Y4_9MICO